MSFTQEADKASTNETDQLTFKVGEREFNADSAATKIGAADEHIKRIEAENAAHVAKLAALEAQLSQSTKLDDALAQLRQQQASPQDSQATTNTNGVSEEQIGAIAKKQMEEYLTSQRTAEQQRAATELSNQTFKQTGEQLTAVYGDKVDEAMGIKAQELGISVQAIFDMAKNPATAKLLLGAMKANVPAAKASPSGSLNTASLNHNASEHLVDYSKKLTSSTIIDALKRSGASY